MIDELLACNYDILKELLIVQLNEAKEVMIDLSCCTLNKFSIWHVASRFCVGHKSPVPTRDFAETSQKHVNLSSFDT